MGSSHIRLANGNVILLFCFLVAGRYCFIHNELEARVYTEHLLYLILECKIDFLKDY